MGFSDIFKKDFLASYTSETVSVPHIVAVLFITCIIGCYIFMVYRVVTRKTFYSRNFNISIAAIAVITAGIILAVQSSIVISLGMVGALSIVRFRTAIKDPMDLIFLFWSISIGIICGAEMYKIGMIMSLVLTIGLFLLELTPVGKASVLLVVNAKDAQAEAGIMQIVGQYAKRPAVKSWNLSKDGMDLIIEIKTAQENKLLAELLAAQNVYGASLMAHDGEIM